MAGAPGPAASGAAPAAPAAPPAQNHAAAEAPGGLGEAARRIAFVLVSPLPGIAGTTHRQEDLMRTFGVLLLALGLGAG